MSWVSWVFVKVIEGLLKFLGGWNCFSEPSVKEDLVQKPDGSFVGRTCFVLHNSLGEQIYKCAFTSPEFTAVRRDGLSSETVNSCGLGPPPGLWAVFTSGDSIWAHLSREPSEPVELTLGPSGGVRGPAPSSAAPSQNACAPGRCRHGHSSHPEPALVLLKACEVTYNQMLVISRAVPWGGLGSQMLIQAHPPPTPLGPSGLALTSSCLLPGIPLVPAKAGSADALHSQGHLRQGHLRQSHLTEPMRQLRSLT